MVTEDPISSVYNALRLLAEQRLASERAGHTLQATALVHDVYLKLAGAAPERWNDTAHFYHAAAEAMRQVLIDHARAKLADKRGGGRRRVPMTEVTNVAALDSTSDPDNVLTLDAAMIRLAELHPEVGQVVRLRFYAGLSVANVSIATGLSERTIKRHWAFARAWLYRRLEPDAGDRPSNS